MRIKEIILPALVIVAVGALIVIFANSSTSNRSPSTSSTPATAEYFDENAEAMYFYSDGCGWCQKQKEVLEEIAKEGYKVKPMNVGEHPEYWQEYQISGTPAFIAPDNQRLAGYQEKEELKEFLDRYK